MSFTRLLKIYNEIERLTNQIYSTVQYIGMLSCELMHAPIALRLKTFVSCICKILLPVRKCYRYRCT